MLLHVTAVKNWSKAASTSEACSLSSSCLGMVWDTAGESKQQGLSERVMVAAVVVVSAQLPDLQASAGWKINTAERLVTIID